jgi:hypothetical protein
MWRRRADAKLPTPWGYRATRAEPKKTGVGILVTHSTDADEWLYYSHCQLCEKLHFVDARIASIEQVEPPH